MNIKKVMTSIVVGSVMLAVPVLPALAIEDTSQQGFNISGVDFAGLQSTDTGLIDSIIVIVNALLILAAIAAIVFIIIGGVRYITAQGDEDAVAQAKNTLIYAIVGIIVILLALVIVNFFVANIQN